jgi:hypothetical protein
LGWRLLGSVSVESISSNRFVRRFDVFLFLFLFLFLLPFLFLSLFLDFERDGLTKLFDLA